MSDQTVLTRQEKRRAFLERMSDVCQDATPEILGNVISFAKAGDMRAAELIIRRSLPERKGALLDIQLPAIKQASDIVEALSQVTLALGNGQVTTDEALALCSLYDFHRRAIETTDLDIRVKRMEENIPAFNPKNGTDDD